MMNVKLRLLLIGCLVLSTTACGNRYQSKKEAEIACDKWVKEGGSLKVETPDSSRGYAAPVISRFRWCRHEQETNQILGWTYEDTLSSQDKEVYSADEWKAIWESGKIVKHFRY